MFNEFKGFKGLNNQISELSKMLSAIGCCESIITFLCARFDIDRVYYADWLCTKDVRDVAELVILYLGEDKKVAICDEFRQLAALN